MNQKTFKADSKFKKKIEEKRSEPKKELNYGTEGASNTCFSSEQESDYKQKMAINNSKFQEKINKLSSIVTKCMTPPVNVTPTTETGKFSDLKKRSIWTFLMLFSFIFVILAGNLYCAILVFIVMVAIYNELLSLEKYKTRNAEIEGFYQIAW